MGQETINFTTARKIKMTEPTTTKCVTRHTVLSNSQCKQSIILYRQQTVINKKIATRNILLTRYKKKVKKDHFS